MLRSGHTAAEVARELGITEERVAAIVWAAVRTIQPTHAPRSTAMTPETRADLVSRIVKELRRP
jgi:predicted transcriptional regulator